MSVVVRAATPDEYDIVGKLTVDAYRTIPVDHLWGGYAEDILDTATRAQHGEVLVAVVDGTIVGSVTYVADPESDWSEWTEPGEAQFRLLAVSADARNSGAGRALIEACIERARTTGQTIMIHTTPWMDVARGMYERMGFVRRPDRDVPYEDWGGPGVDDLPPEWVGQPFLAFSRSP